MTYSIVFSSNTGNTKLLADSIFSVLPAEQCVYKGKPCEQALQAERIYVGFWTDKGSCSKEISEFLKSLHHKEVFLFGTAGFGESAAYFEKILSKVQKHLDDTNTVTGTYMCQGKMPQSVRERYIKMKNSPVPIPNVDALIANFDKALSHPDTEDLERLQDQISCKK